MDGVIAQLSSRLARPNDEQDPRTDRQDDSPNAADSRLSSAPNADVDVLVVDDDESVRSSWAEILDRSGYSAAEAQDGDAALRFLGERSVGMVLLDVRMPRRDGLSVLEALGTPQLVVLVSAYSLDEATQARTREKVVTYLEKPVPPEQLLNVVASVLGHARGQDRGT